MKASELIAMLTILIENHGDQAIFVRGKPYSTNYDNEIGKIIFIPEDRKATEYMSGRGPFLERANFRIGLA